MSCKSLLVLPLVGTLALFLTGSVSAQAAAEPASEQLKMHTVTIYNGSKVSQRTFVWENGSWRSWDDCDHYDVFCRDCPQSPWHFHGSFNSPCRAEEAACSLRASGNLASVRHYRR